MGPPSAHAHYLSAKPCSGCPPLCTGSSHKVGWCLGEMLSVGGTLGTLLAIGKQGVPVAGVQVLMEAVPWLQGPCPFNVFLEPWLLLSQVLPTPQLSSTSQCSG